MSYGSPPPISSATGAAEQPTGEQARRGDAEERAARAEAALAHRMGTSLRVPAGVASAVRRAARLRTRLPWGPGARTPPPDRGGVPPADAATPGAATPVAARGGEGAPVPAAAPAPPPPLPPMPGAAVRPPAPTDVHRLSQRLRYLALAQLLGRPSGASADLLPYELSVLSQNGEDGVLHELIARTGEGPRFFVEIGAHADEANCLLLADGFGWSGLFVDADAEQHAWLADRYRMSERVTAIRALVTPANVDDLLDSAGVPEELGVLSIDIDGADIWVWEAVRRHRARIVVIEYNAMLGAAPLARRYDPDATFENTDRYGASLTATRHMGERLGYTLVHADLSGVNAFFVRDDLWSAERFPAPDDVVARAPNYLLGGFTHRHDENREGFVEL